MPITPRFVLSQTDEILTVTIRTPHVRVSASTLEVVIDDDAIHFYSPPYLLRLTLPGRLVDDAESGREAKATYDPSRDNGTVTVTIYKAQEDVGQWDGLDLVGRLMMNTHSRANADGTNSSSGTHTSGRPAIEVLSSEDAPIENFIATEDDNTATATTSSANPATCTIASENATSALLNLTAQRYGFLQLYHSVFTDLAREGLCHEMLELPEPDATLECDRRSMRLDIEADKFDPGRYLDDAILGEEDASDPHYEDDGCGGDMVFDEAVHMEPHWTKSTNPEKTAASVESIASELGSLSIDKTAASQSPQLTEDEMQLLASVPATHMPPVDFASMSRNQIQSTLLCLLDILFAYAYDHRTTGGDPTVESSWTVAILSPTLSWFDAYNAAEAADVTESAISTDTPADVLLWCIRRSLVYPYLRSYNLGAKIAGDAISILQGGRRVVLRCLLQLRKIFENSTGHYLLNKLYIDPIIFWIQSIEESVLSEFAGGMEKLGKDMQSNSSVWKDRIGLNLIGIEKTLHENEELQEDRSESESSSDDSSSDDDCSSSSDDSDLDSSDGEEGNSNKPAPKVSSELLQIESAAISDGNEGRLSSEKETEVATRKPLIQEL